VGLCLRMLRSGGRCAGRRHEDEEFEADTGAAGSIIDALRRQRIQQAADRLLAGPELQETGLVFTMRAGTAMDAANVRRDLRRALALVPGIDPDAWTPRELRHSFVSVRSRAGVPLEAISQLVGHSGTSVTELVYRHQLHPVIQTGATVMGALFRVEHKPGSTGS